MQPAVVHCRVTCHDPGGTYSEAMGIILTEFGTFAQTRGGDTEDGLYNITFDNIQNCTPSNNYTMEFQYYFYPLSVKMNRSALTCGIVYTSPQIQPPCWGQSYLIINYTSTAVSPSTSIPPSHTASPTITSMNPTPTPSLSSTSSEIIPTVSPTDCQTMVITTTKTISVTPVTGDGPSVNSQVQPAAVYAPPLAILAVALVVTVLVAIIEGVIIVHRRPSNRIGPPPCACTEVEIIENRP